MIFFTGSKTKIRSSALLKESGLKTGGVTGRLVQKVEANIGLFPLPVFALHCVAKSQVDIINHKIVTTPPGWDKVKWEAHITLNRH